MKSVAVAGAGMALAPGELLARESSLSSLAAAKPKGEKVKIAYIGIGNRGQQIIEEFAKTGMVEVVALCDVDLDGKQCEKVLSMYPKAKRFRDFREMFDKCGNEFEAVAAAIPDFSHFPVAMLCMDQGKHIYVEKPMCRTFHEAELMMDCARRHPGVATQVGNQGHSDANYFQFKAWLDAGIIKDVTAVTAHMNNSRRWHGFDAEKMFRMPEEQPIPKNMDWDTWLGTIPYLEYNEKYHQGNWRCWYDTGMGCLGDWGAHILDTVHEFLELGLPYEISMLYEKGHNDYFFPYSSTILFRFPARKGMPPVDVTWYDGLDNLPPLPAGYGGSVAASDVPASSQNSGPEASLAPGKIIYSRDHGKTWKRSRQGVLHTCEAQVAETTEGTLMLNMRNYGTPDHARKVFTTGDMGDSWQPHPSNGTLQEPVCQASLLKIPAGDNILGVDLLFFSNPASDPGTRNRITLRASTDLGLGWPFALMLDEEHGWGYSCIAPVDKETVGILYESGSAQLVFQKIKIKDIVKPQTN